jgi:hypothetical protein
MFEGNLEDVSVKLELNGTAHIQLYVNNVLAD